VDECLGLLAETKYYALENWRTLGDIRGPISEKAIATENKDDNRQSETLSATSSAKAELSGTALTGYSPSSGTSKAPQGGHAVSFPVSTQEVSNGFQRGDV
jgi:hypothetical protein